MLWQELLFPTVVDLIIIVAALCFAAFVWRKAPAVGSPWAQRLLLLGMGLVACYFIVDLLLHWLVPPAQDQAVEDTLREFFLHSLRAPISLAFMIVTLLGFYLTVRDMKRSVGQAEEASAELSDTLKALPDGLLTLDANMQIAGANPTAETLLGAENQSVVGHHIAELFYEHDTDRSLKNGRLAASSLGGRRFPAEISCTEGRNNHQLVLVRDVTETAALEAQLRQSQKMESLGRLAGGIAHDFNNYLTVVLGEVELLDPDYPVSEESATRIREAAERAADLTNQLLSFSRKQVLDTTVFNPNAAIGDMRGLLENLLGKEITLDFAPEEKPAHVQVDRAQFEQVIVNLSINARDAMPGGGTLRISVSDVYLDDAYAARHPDIEPGDYVLVCVTDTGSGMSNDIQEHIFEPFYTTKPRGRGTGLGLAMVMGFIKQSRGTIEVDSEEERGTSMRLYLPAATAAVSAGAAREVMDNGELRGNGHVLVAEDDNAVRAFVVKALTQNGYTVTDFDNAFDALQAVDTSVDLLLTDIVMPHGSGYDLARRARERLPDLPVLYMTGYIDYASIGVDEPAPYAETLRKPFSVRELLTAVREHVRELPVKANSG